MHDDGHLSVNPSTLIKAGGKTYVVNYQHSWTFKRDRIGRRIRGSERSTGWIGVVVSEYDCGPVGPVKEYPPMSAQEAVKRFRAARRDVLRKRFTRGEIDK